MPQSLSSILIHLVFSTKNREPFITPAIESELHPYMATIFRRHDSPSLVIDGTADHLHILFALGRTITTANLVEEVKTGWQCGCLTYHSQSPIAGSFDSDQFTIESLNLLTQPKAAEGGRQEADGRTPVLVTSIHVYNPRADLCSQGSFRSPGLFGLSSTPAS